MTDDARLTLVLDAKIDKVLEKLNTVNRSVHSSMQKAKKDMDDADDRLAKLFGRADAGKALDNIISRSRFAVLEEGSARIKVFGSALEDLGPAGIAAAAGIVAVGAAAEGAKKTSEWADQLETTSKRLQMGVEDIQSWRHAFLMNDIAVEAGEASLQNFNAALGRLQNGAARGQLKKYGALLFSPEELKSLHDASDALPLMATRMQSFGTTTKQAIEQAFEIQALAPLMNQGGQAVQGLLDQAKSLGIVVDESLVKQSAEANDKLKILKEVVGSELTTAFADLAPLVSTVAEKLADAARNARDFFGLAPETQLMAAAAALRQESGGVREMTQRRNSGAYDLGDGVFGHIAGYFSRFQDLGITGILHPQQAYNARVDQLLKDRDALLAKIPKPPTKVKGGGGNNLNLGTTKHPPADRSGDALAASYKALQDQLAAILAGRIQEAGDLLELDKRQHAPLAKLVSDVTVRAALEAEQLKTEGDTRQGELAERQASVRAAKNVTSAAKSTAVANLDAARWALAFATFEKQVAVQKKAQLEVEELSKTASDEAFSIEDAAMQSHLRILEIRQSLADTLTQRRDLALQMLAAEHDEYEKKLRHDLDTRAIDRATYDSGLANSRAVFAAEVGQTNAQMGGPIEQFLRSTKDLDTELQNTAVHAVDSLSSGLAEAAVHAQNLGQVARNVFLQIAAEMVSALLKKDLFGPILGGLFHIPGFAGGTDFAPSGVAVVGERGPELVRFRGGEQVIPNNVLSGIGLPAAGRNVGGITVIQPVVIDAKGSVMTSDLLNQLNTVAKTHADLAYQRIKSEQATASRRNGQRLGSW